MPIIHAVVQLAASSLNPAVYNPRHITPMMFQALKDNIRAHGFLDPVLVQKKGLIIIGGHQRTKALREVCEEDGDDYAECMLPCVVLDIDDRAAKQLNITMNQVAGEFDQEMLTALVEDLNRQSAVSLEEIHGMGFEKVEVDRMLQAPNFLPSADDTAQGRLDMLNAPVTKHSCPKCGHAF